MSWDDTTDFTGDGPHVLVLDSDSTPNRILDTAKENSVQVDWSFTGDMTTPMLNTLTFTVSVYVDPVGHGDGFKLGSVQVLPGNPLTATIKIPAGTLLSAGPDPIDPTKELSGVYRLTTIISTSSPSIVPGNPPVRWPIEGFRDGPTIEMRTL